MSIKEFRNYTTMSYKERMNLRMQLKSKFNQVNDPILQRGNQYKITEVKPPTKNDYPKHHHLSTSQYEDPLIAKRIRTQKTNEIFSTDANAKINQRDKILKRVFTDKANSESQQKDIKTYKVFPESYNLKIKSVMRTEENQKTQEDEQNERENSRIRYLVQEQRRRLMTPSPVIKQMNDRKFLLPSEYQTKYNVHLRAERPKSSLNTAQRIFTDYVPTNQNNQNTDCLTDNENTNSNFKKSTSYYSYKPADSMSNLISYKFAPEYREQLLTEKPTSPASRKPLKNSSNSYIALANRRGLKTFYNTNDNLTTNSNKFY